MTAKYGGLALSTGIILAIVGALLFPGGPVIDRVDQTDFRVAAAAMGEAPALTHTMSYLTIVAMLLQIFGAVGLFHLASGQGGLGGTLLKFGAVASIIEWSIILMATGMRHFVTHLLQRAENAADGSEIQMGFNNAALAVYTDMMGVFVAFIALFPIASALVGLGLVGRFPTLSVYKIAAYGLIVAGAAGVVNFLVAMYMSGPDPWAFLIISNVLLNVAALCLLVTGIGMYQSRVGLAEEPEEVSPIGAPATA